TDQIPSKTLIVNQGAKNFTLSGTGLTQPLTQLFRVRAANDVASAEVAASRGKARATANEGALKVRQLYYRILIVQSPRRAVEAKIRAVEDLQKERIEQVKYGSALDLDLIDTKAQSLQAKQELLTAELQLSDLRMQFNDVVGLPVQSEIALDSNIPAALER